MGSWLTRVPYATLLALILNWCGVAIFCVSLYRGVNLSLRMLQDVFQLDRGLSWIEPTQMAFLILASVMAALALMILVVAILATGSTRDSVYNSKWTRASGRVASIVFIALTYLLLVAWMLVFAFCVVLTVFYTVSWGVCNTDEIGWEEGFIDLYPYHFLFPKGTQREHMEIRGAAEIKMFCKDFVEHAEVMFVLATSACALVIISLVHFLMALASNYAHIRGHDKFSELRDLHDIAASETITLTERSHNHTDHHSGLTYR